MSILARPFGIAAGACQAFGLRVDAFGRNRRSAFSAKEGRPAFGPAEVRVKHSVDKSRPRFIAPASFAPDDLLQELTVYAEGKSDGYCLYASFVVAYLF